MENSQIILICVWLFTTACFVSRTTSEGFSLVTLVAAITLSVFMF